MKTLSFEQMEEVGGGRDARKNIGCAFGILGFGLAAAGLVLVTGGTAAVLVAGLSYSIAPAAAALSCI